MGLFPLEDVRTMVFELSLIRSAFRGAFLYLRFLGQLNDRNCRLWIILVKSSASKWITPENSVVISFLLWITMWITWISTLYRPVGSYMSFQLKYKIELNISPIFSFRYSVRKLIALGFSERSSR